MPVSTLFTLLGRLPPVGSRWAMPGGSETLPAQIRGCVRGWRPFSSSLVHLLYALQPLGQSWLPVTLHLSLVSTPILRKQPRLWPSVSLSLTLSLSSVHLFGLRLFSAAIPNYIWFVLFFVKFLFVCVQTIFKLFTEYFLQYCFCFIFFSFLPWVTRDLGSPTRDRTHSPCIGRCSLNHWIAREVPHLVCNTGIFGSLSLLGVCNLLPGDCILDVQTQDPRPGSGSRGPRVSPGRGPRRLASPQTCSDNPGPASRSLSPCLAEDAGWLWKPRAVYSSADANKRDPNGPGRTWQEEAKLFCTHGSPWHKTLNIFNNCWILPPWSMPK